MSTETELRHTVVLTETERRLIADVLNREWDDCDTARHPGWPTHLHQSLIERQGRVEALLRKLGYL